MMLGTKKQKANVSAGIWFVTLALLIFLFSSGQIEGNIWDNGNALAILVFTVHGLSFFSALWWYGRDRRSIRLQDQLAQSNRQDPFSAEQPQESHTTDAESQEWAERLHKINVLCQLAEVHLEDLDDEYERNKLMERIENAKAMALDIDDPAAFELALRLVITLAHKAGWEETKNELLKLIPDPLERQDILDYLKTK